MTIDKLFQIQYTQTQYLPILIFFIIASLLSLFLFLLSFNTSTRKKDTEKLSSYECGFAPFDDTRKLFEIRYYLIAILFIIFDLELLYIYPWIVVLKCITSFGYLVMFFFLIILLIGFIYEWKRSGLDWK